VKLDRTILRELTGLADNERTILSVYLDLSRGWDAAEGFIEREKKRLLPVLNAGEKDYFETSLSFFCDVTREMKEKNMHSPGLAFFADLGADYTRAIELDIGPDPLIAVDDEAILHPLACILDEYEPVGVIMLDASGARILIAAGEKIESVDALKTKIHHLSKVGGWSQMRYQRRRQKQVQRFAKDIAVSASTIFKEEQIQRIVLAGRDRMITALEQELSQGLKKKVIATIRWDLSDTDSDLLEKIRPIMERAERDQEENLLSRLNGELRRNGLAAAGNEAVQRALSLGQVDTLFLSMGLEKQITEELVSQAETTASAVEFIPLSNSSLQPYGGVAALLRFKIRK
jgi:peptide chain release factor subunit 1